MWKRKWKKQGEPSARLFSPTYLVIWPLVLFSTFNLVFWVMRTWYLRHMTSVSVSTCGEIGRALDPLHRAESEWHGGAACAWSSAIWEKQVQHACKSVCTHVGTHTHTHTHTYKPAHTHTHTQNTRKKGRRKAHALQHRNCCSGGWEF